MTVTELIKALKLMPQDLEVYSICDHGQNPEKSMLPSVQYLDNDGNYTSCGKIAKEYGYDTKGVLL